MTDTPEDNADRLALKLQGLRHEAEEEAAARTFVARKLKKGDQVTVGDVRIEIISPEASLVVHHPKGAMRTIKKLTIQQFFLIGSS